MRRPRYNRNPDRRHKPGIALTPNNYQLQLGCPQCGSFNVGLDDFEDAWCVDCNYITDFYDAWKVRHITRAAALPAAARPAPAFRLCRDIITVLGGGSYRRSRNSGGMMDARGMKIMFVETFGRQVIEHWRRHDVPALRTAWGGFVADMAKAGFLTPRQAARGMPNPFIREDDKEAAHAFTQ